MSDWMAILESQLEKEPPILTVDDAAEIYSSAPLNELMYVALERRKAQVPGTVSYTHLTLPTTPYV